MAGTVDFTDGGTTIAGRGAQALSGSGQATCSTTLAAEGDQSLDATYSGATSGASTYIASSELLTQAVNNHTTVNGNTYALDSTSPDVHVADVVGPDPAERIVKAAEAIEPMLALLILAALTGARRGELCALRWSDVDW